MCADDINSRRFDRVDVQLRTVYHDEIDADESDSLMSNLSLGGCFISTTRPLELGSTIRLKFRLEKYEVNVEATGIVRWIKEGEGGGMGIQFQDIARRDLNLLKRFIEEKIGDSLFA